MRRIRKKKHGGLLLAGTVCLLLGFQLAGCGASGGEEAEDSFLYGKAVVGGDAYRFPAPVSAFLENGWEPEPGSLGQSGPERGLATGGKTVMPGMLDTLHLTRDGKELEAGLINYGEGPAAVTDCFLYQVRAELSEEGEDEGLELILPRGIQVGMKEDELLPKLKGAGYRVAEDRTETMYVINGPYYTSGYVLTVKDGQVDAAEVNFALMKAEWQVEEKLRGFEEGHPKRRGMEKSLSGDLYSYQVELGGTILRVPCTVAEMEEAGFMCLDGQMEVEPGGKEPMPFYSRELGRLDCWLKNGTSDRAAASDCSVTQIHVSGELLSSIGVSAKLPAGVRFGESTVEDAIKAYGEPDREDAGADMAILEYDEEIGRDRCMARLFFRQEDGKLSDVELVNTRIGE